METGEDVLANVQSAQDVQENELSLYDEDEERNTLNTTSSSCCSPLSPAREGSNPKRERKVSFPDDSSLVRSVEPFDPWKDAGNCTSKEVIDAYRKICTQLKVKPCEKLIKQLEACETFNDRINVIDLRGTKLDLRSCETLEEVLRKVRTKTLDLENTSLEDEGTLSILEMVEFYHSACKLNLAYNNKIRVRGWQALGRTLKRTPCLEYLDVRHTVWTEQSIPLLGRSLRLNCPLTILHMEATNLSGRPLFLLANAIKANQLLKDLFLGDNKLVPSDGQCIGAMLKTNTTLRLLDLRNNSLQDMGLGHICDGLAEQVSDGLQTLVLWNNQLTFQGMSYLSKALVSIKSLQTLNLGHNRLTNEGIHHLKDGLLLNMSLQRLGLLNTRLTSEGIIALAEVIADSKILLRLDIRENDPYVGGLMALSLALKMNYSLVRIDLDKELKKEPGMETTQRCLLADIYGFCQRNKTMIENKEGNASQKTSNVTQSVTASVTPSTSISHNASNTNTTVTETATTSKANSDNLLQIEPTQPKSRFDLKNFGGFTSRFRITRIFESSHSSESSPTVPTPTTTSSTSNNIASQNSETEEDLQEDLLICCEDSSSSEGEGLLVDIESESSSPPDMATELENLDLDVFESDSSSSQDTDWESRVDNYACGSRESVDSMGTPIARSELQSDKEHAAHFYERELDALLSNNHYEGAALTNKHQNDNEFWMQDFDGINSMSTTSNVSIVDPPTADLLGS